VYNEGPVSPQARLDDYMRRLEEAERNAQIAEAKIAERDLRITEVERLLNCMAQVNKYQFAQSLAVTPEENYL